MSDDQEPEFYKDFDTFWATVESAPNRIESVPDAARLFDKVIEFANGDWADYHTNRKGIARRAFYEFSSELAEDEPAAKRAIERLFHDLVQGRELLGEVGPGAFDLFGLEWLAGRAQNFRDYFEIEDDEELKFCRVCKKRIRADHWLFVGRRFYCRSCRHRTHVHCAADVEGRLCRKCQEEGV